MKGRVQRFKVHGLINQTPDLILSNGRLYTLEATSTVAEALAIKDGRFVAVGANAVIGDPAGPGTRQLDLIRLSPFIPW